ncbi:NADP-dependent dehydrogenase-like protein [Lasiosphaeria miniovina]|uniref:NADP-dependent dehydrogenase-like protein n=1 Tax=Lasiosphaeria miniovina TaxID=1954250 RepID=A0AA40ABG8_9PEZI|nr:NADP-dependent dehydrogenase-like protein [Lasiosphaeria miniovina]KAK0712771.1 NADP-dependent dehydrogenase-like protein [Lasiosphaeria miniovina]
MTFPYKKVLIIGATSGIGLELAEHLVKDGAVVIAAGRRRDRLEAFVSKHGAGKAFGEVLDLTDINSLPSFVQSIIETHPDLDCAVFNAGVQNIMDFSRPHTVDLAKIQREVTVNYVSMVALTHGFLPFFQAKAAQGETATIVYTSTSLIAVPYPPAINYCASKAALRSFVLSVREQLKRRVTEASPTSVKLVEIITPLVQTDLHAGQPGWAPDFNPGMPVVPFVDAVVAGLAAGDEIIAVGPAQAIYDEFEAERSRRVRPHWDMIRGHLGGAHQFA